jgi:hypothetical protein
VSGSGGDRGYDYQADTIAYIAAHGLAGQPLGWFDGINDIPARWLVETGGPGDDIRVVTGEGCPIEIQCKHGLRRGSDYDSMFSRLCRGLQVDAELRGVVLVDRHSSEAIRSDLKNDLSRIGQGRTDATKPITKELLKAFAEQGLTDLGLFARLQIIVVDLDEGADGVAAACSLLSAVVDPTMSGTAFELLGKRGHALTKNRGQDDIVKCARYLDARLGFRGDSISPALAIVRFAAWTRKTNETFYSPAMQQNYPIARAWCEVAPMDRTFSGEVLIRGSAALDLEIRRYHEWLDLGQRRKSDEAVTASAFVQSHRLSAIVGGPGSGKSTISKRLAHCTSEERLSVRVRLPSIAAALGRGQTFDQSLVDAAIDSSGCDRAEGARLLSSADFLSSGWPRRMRSEAGRRCPCSD